MRKRSVPLGRRVKSASGGAVRARLPAWQPGARFQEGGRWGPRGGAPLSAGVPGGVGVLGKPVEGLDFSKCHDGLRLAALLEVVARAGIPPAVAWPMLACYSGWRLVRADGLAGPVERLVRGLAPGCPAATPRMSWYWWPCVGAHRPGRRVASRAIAAKCTPWGDAPAGPCGHGGRGRTASGGLLPRLWGRSAGQRPGGHRVPSPGGVVIRSTFRVAAEPSMSIAIVRATTRERGQWSPCEILSTLRSRRQLWP